VLRAEVLEFMLQDYPRNRLHGNNAAPMPATCATPSPVLLHDHSRILGFRVSGLGMRVWDLVCGLGLSVLGLRVNV